MKQSSKRRHDPTPGTIDQERLATDNCISALHNILTEIDPDHMRVRHNMRKAKFNLKQKIRREGLTCKDCRLYTTCQKRIKCDLTVCDSILLDKKENNNA